MRIVNKEEVHPLTETPLSKSGKLLLPASRRQVGGRSEEKEGKGSIREIGRYASSNGHTYENGDVFI